MFSYPEEARPTIFVSNVFSGPIYLRRSLSDVQYNKRGKRIVVGRWDSSCRGLTGPRRASIGVAIAAFIVPMKKEGVVTGRNTYPRWQQVLAAGVVDNMTQV